MSTEYTILTRDGKELSIVESGNRFYVEITGYAPGIPHMEITLHGVDELKKLHRSLSTIIGYFDYGWREEGWDAKTYRIEDDGSCPWPFPDIEEDDE
jgi:hypothetical protein